MRIASSHSREHISEKAEVPVTQDLIDVQVFRLASGVQNPANAMTNPQKHVDNNLHSAELTVLVLSPCSCSGSPPGTTGHCRARRAALLQGHVQHHDCT